MKIIFAGPFNSLSLPFTVQHNSLRHALSFLMPGNYLSIYVSIPKNLCLFYFGFCLETSLTATQTIMGPSGSEIDAALFHKL